MEENLVTWALLWWFKIPRGNWSFIHKSRKGYSNVSVTIELHLVSKFSIQFLGFGRWSNNCLLSFIEDSQFPIPFCQKVDVTNSDNIKKSSWRRRVDINTAFYLGMLIAFSILNIVYSSLEVSSYSYFDLRRFSKSRNY